VGKRPLRASARLCGQEMPESAIGRGWRGMRLLEIRGDAKVGQNRFKAFAKCQRKALSIGAKLPRGGGLPRPRSHRRLRLN
jgi:hypothetical protein